MMGFIRGLIICIGLLEASAGLAKPAEFDPKSTKFKVDWRCPKIPQTYAPPWTEFTIKFDLQNQKLDANSSEHLNQFVSRITENTQNDAFPCLARLLNQVLNQVNSEYSKAFPKDYTNEEYKKFTAGIDRFRAQWNEKLADYARKISLNSAVSVIVPGHEQEDIFPVKSTEDSLIHNCRLPIDTPLIAHSALSKKYLKERLPQVLKQAGENIDKKDCARQIAQDYQEMILAATPAEANCDQTGLNQTLDCKERRRQLTDAIELLARTRELRPYFKPESDQIGSCGQDINDFYNTILESSAQFESLQQCVQLSPGESAVIHSKQLTGLSASYTLLHDKKKRNGKPLHRAFLNIKFLQEENPMNTDSGLVGIYEDRFRECFEKPEFKRKLRGPNGEYLEVGLWKDLNQKDKKKIAKPPTTSITVSIDSKHRSHSGKWNPEIECSTVLHEVGHNLGLTDGYQETQIGVIIQPDNTVLHVKEGAEIAAYDCRVLEPEDSLMHSQDAAIDAIRAGKIGKICTCDEKLRFGGFGGGFVLPTTNPGGLLPSREEREKMLQEAKKAQKQFTDQYNRQREICLSALKTTRKGASTCPKGTQPREANFDLAEADDRKKLVELKEGKLFSTHYAGGFSTGSNQAAPEKKSQPARLVGLVDRNPKESLLYPAHFRAIVNPGCFEKNKTYFICAQESRKTSKAAYGEDECARTLPKECRKGGSEWLK